MSSTDVMKSELLTADNYETWKLQVRSILILENLWGYVCGTIPRPIEIRNQYGAIVNLKDLEAWREKDARALARITLSISPIELRHIRNCATSYDAWKKLVEVFESRPPAREIVLLQQLLFLKMQESDDVRAHLKKFEETVDRLHRVDIFMPERLLTVILMYSLPASYENFRMAIEAKHELPSLGRLRMKIIEESESRLGRRPNVPCAMVECNSGARKDKNSRQDNIRCIACKKVCLVASDLDAIIGNKSPAKIGQDKQPVPTVASDRARNTGFQQVDEGRAQAEDVGSSGRGIESEGLNTRGLQEKIFGCEKRIDIYTNKLNDVLSGFKEMKNEFGHITYALRQFGASQKRKSSKTNEPEPGPSKEKTIPNPPAGNSNNQTSDAFNPNTSQAVIIEDFDLIGGEESQGPAKRKKLASDKDANNERPGENNKQISDERGELTFIKDEDGYVSVYTDGCCLGNGNINAKAGIGIWFGENHPLNVGEPYKGVTPTNNNAEIQAARIAIEIALKTKISKLKIITDSQFLINSVTEWIPKWKLNNWTSSTNKSIVNRVELEKLDKVMSLLSVRWEKVVGHSGIRGNEAADMLANKGAESYGKI